MPIADARLDRHADQDMPAQLVVTHERIGTWARQVFPRLEVAGVSFRGIESRSGADLVGAVRSAFRPAVILDVGERPVEMLGDLAAALVENSDCLALVIDRKADEDVKTVAKHLGATHVLSGPVTPPDVFSLVSRWIAFAKTRAEREGWRPVDPPKPEPWERPELLLDRRRPRFR